MKGNVRHKIIVAHGDRVAGFNKQNRTNGTVWIYNDIDETQDQGFDNKKEVNDFVRKLLRARNEAFPQES